MGTINKIRKIAKQKVAKEIYEVYEENGMHRAIDYAEEYNSKHISQIPFEWCEPCDNNMPSIDHECCICGSETIKPSKPKFYQAVLKPIKDVITHVYPQGGITLEERMGNNAQCPECGKNEWLLLAQEQVAVREGGKPYCECLNCGMVTHL